MRRDPRRLPFPVNLTPPAGRINPWPGRAPGAAGPGCLPNRKRSCCGRSSHGAKLIVTVLEPTQDLAAPDVFAYRPPRPPGALPEPSPAAVATGKFTPALEPATDT